MTREPDRKRGNDELDDYSQKVEDRFDKEARAKVRPDGSINGRKMGRSHATDGTEYPL